MGHAFRAVATKVADELREILPGIVPGRYQAAGISMAAPHHVRRLRVGHIPVDEQIDRLVARSLGNEARGRPSVTYVFLAVAGNGNRHNASAVVEPKPDFI